MQKYENLLIIRHKRLLLQHHNRVEAIVQSHLPRHHDAIAHRIPFMENLKEKTARGLMWGAVNNGAMQVLYVIFGIVLGRLLTPAEYGIVGVLTIFTAIAGAIQASGFTQGLINLKSPTARDYNSVFWFNMLASVTLYAILFFCAPLIARFFHQPCLTEVSRVLFLCLPISAVGIACNSYLLKNMRNKEIAVINLSAILISGITGTIMAFNGFSYWSLVWQQLIYNIVTNIGRYIFARWRPSLKIDFGPVKEMFGFCSKLLITNILNTLNQHLLTFVFGRLFPIHSVGNYTQASKWSNMAHSTVSNTLWQVVQPVFVAVNDDRERELRVFRKLLRFTAFLSFPIMLGLALVSREFILVTIGERWLGCVMLMRIICIGGAFMPFYVLFQNLSISKGRSDLYMWCNICQIVAQLAIILLLSNQNIEIIVGASAAFTILWLLAWQNIGHRLIGLSLWELLKDLIPFLVVALAVMAATYFLTASITQPIVLLLARVAIAAVLYVGAMRLLHAKVMEECIRFILRKNKTL